LFAIIGYEENESNLNAEWRRVLRRNTQSLSETQFFLSGFIKFDFEVSVLG
jgi:hypothetical protein